jgi:hypothetical protein
VSNGIPLSSFVKVVEGAVTVAFLRMVSSIEKLAVPPLNVPMISIRIPF